MFRFHMAHLPVLKPLEVVRVVKKLGFVLDRQTGSHMIFRHSNSRWTIVPMHTKTIGKGLPRKIIKDTGLTPEEFLKIK